MSVGVFLEAPSLRSQAGFGGKRTSTTRIVHGPGIDQPLASIDPGGTVSYYLADHLGSIVQQTDATGTVTLTRQYDPYGVSLQGGADSGYAFTGREWDAEIGLYYYRARYFDPGLGRFLSPDPIGLSGPNTNLYGYVLNAPLSWRDPSGNNPAVWVLGGLATATAPAWVEPVLIVIGIIVTTKAIIDLTKPLFAKDEQDKRLTPGDIRELKDRDIDPEGLKGGRKTGPMDLFKKPNGDIVVKPKDGSGPGEPTGFNIRDIRRSCKPRR